MPVKKEFCILVLFLLCIPFSSPAQDTVICYYVEEMPSYQGGETGMAKFLEENISYPELARSEKISGVVMVNFIVNADGSLSDIVIQNGIGGGCDEECIRVVKLMPDWNPGKQAGKPVRVMLTLPVRFALTTDKMKKQKKDELE